MTRVKKKSFLLATILVPLIFPTVIAVMAYVKKQEEANRQQELIYLLNDTDFITFEDSDKYKFFSVNGLLDSVKAEFSRSDAFALIYIPSLEIENPTGVSFYAKTSPGVSRVLDFEKNIEGQIRDKKLKLAGLTDDQLDQFKSDISIASFNITESGDEEQSDSNSTFWISYVMGFLIYIFLFAYGSQVMQGVIEEKSSKIVEVILSTIRPFQMMLGKVVGVAAVGATQLIIWMFLMGIFWTVSVSLFGIAPDQSSGSSSQISDAASSEFFEILTQANWLQIIPLFIFYFLGGYLLYGALFAAIGSAIDTPADAQQFMIPVMLPIIISLMGLFMFVFEDPHGTSSFWLSIIPFTSPVVMMGRIGFGVPAWEIALSMLLLAGGGMFTLWMAGRIYRIGILMHGAKVNYKVLARWVMMKN